MTALLYTKKEWDKARKAKNLNPIREADLVGVLGEGNILLVKVRHGERGIVSIEEFRKMVGEVSRND